MDANEQANEQLIQARAEIAALKAENERLKQDIIKLRGVLRSHSQDKMATKLKDALRE
ncbi:hypothetical protein [Paenibacillus spongiae]|uniref:Transposase n=1 Tax=Paenibacillus spongiae TaxID=2909671 RepID=A0ABY5SF46_9BACL|nr:hypothetical protein [Paenibacillus spongiae]UVI31125.1 hypothetical protein L1F29_04570 [Paenibacillus spongiae]